MENTLYLLGAASIGFSHSFETDHLVAVSSIVTRRNNIKSAVQDGILWGLGHTSTILLVAFVYLIGKFILNEADFHYFEAGVGLMLIGLGMIRFYRILEQKKHGHTHHETPSTGLAFGVGLIHGLAGSGGLLISVLTEIKEPTSAIIYILIFGLGSVFGMMIAAGFFSLPFSAKYLQNKYLAISLSILSAMLCISLGIWIFFKNIF